MTDAYTLHVTVREADGTETTETLSAIPVDGSTQDQVAGTAARDVLSRHPGAAHVKTVSTPH